MEDLIKAKVRCYLLGFAFIGAGVGLFFGKLFEGLLLGIGAGFIILSFVFKGFYSKIIEGVREMGFVKGGLLFMGSIFIGAGIGLLFNHLAVGILIGVGLGFILMGFLAGY
ncbi:MAG TPA: hypothetical protein GXX15_06540 [Clostridia bacterium]|nr:hypothetical protein [Clostridia bacterium]